MANNLYMNNGGILALSCALGLGMDINGMNGYGEINLLCDNGWVRDL